MSKTTKKVAATEQPHRGRQRKTSRMSRKKKTIMVASTEETPKNNSRLQPEDEVDDNPLACIDYACEAISSAFDCIIFGKEEEEKQTDRKSSAAPDQASAKKQIVVATDATEKKISQKEEKAPQQNITPKASSKEEEIEQAGIKCPNEPGNDESIAGKKQLKKKSSKQRMKAVLGKLFKKRNKKSSTAAAGNAPGNTVPSKPTGLDQCVAVDMRKSPVSQPDSTKNTHFELDSESIIEHTAQPESTDSMQQKPESASNDEEHIPQEQVKMHSEALNAPAPQPQMAEELPATPKKARKEVSFGSLPEKIDAPPSPTAVASDALFGLIDTMVGKPHVNQDNLSAARAVQIPDSDSDSDVENDDSEVESVLDETSSKHGTFDVVKDMNEMWEQKEEVISELNEMWQESDQDLVKVISAHISFDEDEDDEPLESDYVLARYEQIVAAEQKLASFQQQPQIIAAV